MITQGEMTDQTVENLGESDRGVALYRRTCSSRSTAWSAVRTRWASSAIRPRTRPGSNCPSSAISVTRSPAWPPPRPIRSRSVRPSRDEGAHVAFRTRTAGRPRSPVAWGLNEPERPARPRRVPPDLASGRAKQKARTRQALVDAAMAFVREGRRLLDRRCGGRGRCGGTTAYCYFPTKDALFAQAVLTLVASDDYPDFYAVFQQSTDVAARVNAVVETSDASITLHEEHTGRCCACRSKLTRPASCRTDRLPPTVAVRRAGPAARGERSAIISAPGRGPEPMRGDRGPY